MAAEDRDLETSVNPHDHSKRGGQDDKQGKDGKNPVKEKLDKMTQEYRERMIKTVI